MTSHRILQTSIVSLVLAVSLVPRAGAQTATGWTGAGGNSLWSTGTNWDNGAPPGIDTNTRDLFFGNSYLTAGGTGTRTAQNDLTAFSGYRITFQDTVAAVDPDFTITGNAFTLFDFGGNAPRIENQSTSLQTIALGGALTLNGTNGGGFAEINPVNGDLLISNAVTLAGTTQLRVWGNNGKTVTFNGIVSGANSVAINQNSSVVFGAANTYTGDTFINAGSLNIAQGGSLSAGTVQLGDTAATGSTAMLRISDLDGGTTLARPIVVRAGSSGIKTIAGTNSSGINTFSGTVALNDAVTVDAAAGGTVTLSGIVSGAGVVTKTGDGILTLSGANTLTGGLVLNGGRTRLTVANTMSGGITLNAGGTLEANTAAADSATFNNLLGAAGNSFVFNGGTVLMSAATTANVDRTVTGRNIAVGAGGATFDIAGAYSNQVEGILNQFRFDTTSVLSGTGTLTKNGGGRIQFQNATGSGFSGAVVINNGTVEAAGTALGNASATNTITVNGGNFAISGNVAQKVILNGGAISANGVDRTVTGGVDVAAPSYTFLNDFWRDFDSAGATNNIARRILISGQLTGSAALGVVVNRAGYQFNTGSLVLQNSNNSYSGTITVGKNLRLENNATAGFGKTLGTAAIVLADGGLNLRDNGDAFGATGATFNYGNNVSLIAPTDFFDRGTRTGSALIDVNRASGTVAANNTFKLGSLSIGARPLTVQGGSGYGVEFGGASQITDNVTFNVTTASLAFSGGLAEDVAGRTLTKNGAGTLTFASEAAYTGATVVNGGALTLAGATGRLNGTPSITLTGAALNIDNSTSLLANRVADAVPISLAGASIAFTSPAATATSATETLGPVTISGLGNTIAANQGNPGGISALTLASLTRQNLSTLKFVGTNLGQTGNSSRIILADQTANVALLAPWITINGTDFAQYVTATDGGFVRGVTAVDYVTDPVDDSGFTTQQNLRLTGTTTTALTADRTVNTVNFANAADTRTLDLGGRALTLVGGGIIVGTNAAAITGTAAGGLYSGTPEFVITNNAALSISAPIRDNSGAVSLTKLGAGTLTLSGASTFTGDIRFAQGTLSLSDVANSGSASNIGAGGTLRLSDLGATTLSFTGASDATDHPLVIGAPGATLEVTTAAANLAWNGALTSGGSLTKIGTGTFTIGGPGAVTGNVAVTAGTLGVAGATAISGNLDVANGTASGTLTGTGGGSLSVGSGSANSINIAMETVGTASNTVGVVNLSGLNSFTANVGTIGVGGEGTGANGTGNNTGTLILAKDNTIVASTSIVVGDSTGNGDPGTRGTLTFGSGINDVTTPVLTVGGRKYSAVGSIATGGTLILDNGTGRTALNVGTGTNIDTGTVPVSSFSLAGGTFIASLSNVNVGIRSGGGNGDMTATLNLGSSATTNVNVNVGSGFAARIGGIDYSTGTQPLDETATGTLVIGGGTVSLTSTNTGSSAVVIGHFNGTAAITGTQSASQSNAANGTLTINGGDVTITSAGTTNAINLGPLILATGTVGTNTASGTLNINGGSLTVNNPIVGNSTTTGSTSALSLTGGLLNMQGKNLTNINNLTFSGGTLRNLGTLNRALTQTGETSLLDVVANNSTISGAYSVTDGDVSIAATRTLNATGGTVVSGTGSVLVNGSLQGSLTVNAGASVKGAGTTQALTLAGGTIAPGNSPGILSTGNLSLGGGTLALEMNSATAGTGYDQVNVAGTVSLTANTDFTLSFGYIPAVGEQFVIINNDSTDLISFSNGALLRYNGITLADDTRFSTAQGMEFEINYNGGTGNDIVLVTTVPEPSSAVALLAGIASLTGLRRFRRGSRHAE